MIYRIVYLLMIMVVFGCKNEIQSKDGQNIVFEKPKGNTPGKIIGNVVGCGFDKIQKSNEILIRLPGDKEMAQINNILSFSGLPSNFQIWEANVGNAYATIINGERVIIYDKALLNSVDRNPNSYWASSSILAHEIGHHLAAHTFDGGSTPTKELEADKFSGNILFKLGATLEQASAAMATIGDDFDSDTHPNKNRRLQAIAEGWNSASTNRYKSAIPPPPDNEDLFDKNFVQNEFLKEDLIHPVVLAEPNFGGYINEARDKFTEGIIVDIKKDDPSGGQRTEFFDLPHSSYNLVITMEITNSQDADYPIGKRKIFHLLDYAQGSNSTIGTLQSLLVPGRKIRIKAVYFGYGAADIYYIKRIPRNFAPSQVSSKSNRVFYEVKNEKAYFHNLPSHNSKRAAYLVNGEVVQKLKEENGFIYIEFLNPKGQKSVGWILKSTLK